MKMCHELICEIPPGGNLGSLPYIKIKGNVLVEEWMEVLYAYNINGRYFSQSSSLRTYERNMSNSIRFDRSTKPST